MSLKVTCLNDPAVESFFHIMKAEAFYQKEIDTYETLVSQISIWINDYNFSRIILINIGINLNFFTHFSLSNYSPFHFVARSFDNSDAYNVLTLA